MAQKFQAQIGIFGGSGFYDFLKNGEQIEIKTPYGWPSDKIFVSTYAGKNWLFCRDMAEIINIRHIKFLIGQIYTLLKCRE